MQGVFEWQRRFAPDTRLSNRPHGEVEMLPETLRIPSRRPEAERYQVISNPTFMPWYSESPVNSNLGKVPMSPRFSPAVATPFKYRP